MRPSKIGAKRSMGSQNLLGVVSFKLLRRKELKNKK